MADHRFDVLVIGGGFYGCCLALYLRSVAQRIAIVEQERELLQRASFVNQARVHTGFHYPRSFVTALRSLQNYSRFLKDFDGAICDNFKMLYAIARYGSKISARRFFRMYADMHAPIARAPVQFRALFDLEAIEEVFLCEEFAFDAATLHGILGDRLTAAGAITRCGTKVERISPISAGAGLVVELEGGERLQAQYVFNCTYAQVSAILRRSRVKPVPVKHEIAEIALVEPPVDLENLGVTVMDGPFFSIMPFPARNSYSLTHVRYTPHLGWIDEDGLTDPYVMLRRASPSPRWRHMVCDARRYLPCAGTVRWQESLFEVKTLPVHHEIDDGRPILFIEHDEMPGLFSVLGGKIDNIYDLFAALEHVRTHWSGADGRWLLRPLLAQRPVRQL